ncbi:hypothetical protein [Microbacterium sp. NPDC055357]
MVFDPTFNEISKEADELPDLNGSDGEPPFEGEEPADDLPPFGKE